MPYRSMKMPEQPAFTFVERLFVSGKSYQRVLGQTIMFAESIAGVIVEWIKGVAPIFTILFVVMLPLAGWFWITHHYHWDDMIAALGWIGTLVVVGLGYLAVCRAQRTVRINNQAMQFRIEAKLKEKQQ